MYLIINIQNPPSGKLGSVESIHMTREAAKRELKRKNQLFGSKFMVEESKIRRKVGELI